MSLLFLLAAIVLAAWAALADAGTVTRGVPMQLLACAVACFAAAFLPWWARRP